MQAAIALSSRSVLHHTSLATTCCQNSARTFASERAKRPRQQRTAPASEHPNDARRRRRHPSITPTNPKKLSKDAWKPVDDAYVLNATISQSFLEGASVGRRDTLLRKLRGRNAKLNDVNAATLLHTNRKHRLGSLDIDDALFLIKSIGTTPVFGAERLALCAHGLPEFGDSPEARALVDVLATRLAACDEPFGAKSVTMALYGLHKLTDCAEVREFLGHIAPRVAKCVDMDARGIGSALYGLQGLGEHRRVLRVIEALTAKTAI